MKWFDWCLVAMLYFSTYGLVIGFFQYFFGPNAALGLVGFLFADLGIRWLGAAYIRVARNYWNLVESRSRPDDLEGRVILPVNEYCYTLFDNRTELRKDPS